MRLNIQYDHQQWYQWYHHLVHRVYGLIAHLTYLVQHWWWIRLTNTDEFSKDFGLIRYGKPVSKRPVFQCSLLTFSKNSRTLDWVKSPNHAAKYTILLPQWDQWPQHFPRCVSWLITLSTDWVKYRWRIRLIKKLANYQSCLASFTMANKMKNDRSFSTHILTLLEISFLSYSIQCIFWFCVNGMMIIDNDSND